MKKFASLSLSFFCLTGFLNVSNKLFFCALIYVLMATVAYSLCHFIGKKIALSVIMVSLMVTCGIIVGHTVYGTHFPLMVPGSFCAIFLSLYAGMIAMDALARNFKFYKRIFISLSIASCLDSAIVVWVILLPKFSFMKLCRIFVKDIAFKGGYSVGVVLLLLTLDYIYKKYFSKDIQGKTALNQHLVYRKKDYLKVSWLTKR